MSDWDARALQLHEDGNPPERIAARLIADGAGPIDAIKALRSIGIPLRDGKDLVDAGLPPHVRESNDRLRDQLAQFLESHEP